MNLRELEYLVAVAEERNFHRAAARCYVSQPTLSGQLKKLEQELGVQLVERTTRQVVMTDVGTAIARQARKIIAEVKNIREISDAYQDVMAGDIHLGLIPTLAPYLLPLIMPAIRKRYPKLKLWLHEYQTDDLLERLRQAELDLLILALPVESDEFEELFLFNEPFYLALPSSEALADKQQIAFADLDNRELLLLEEGHCLRSQALDVCYRAGAAENTAFHASSLETLRYMVTEGMGMTLMPQLAVPEKVQNQELIRYLPFREPRPARTIGMLFRKASYRKETFENLRQLVALQMFQAGLS